MKVQSELVHKQYIQRRLWYFAKTKAMLCVYGVCILLIVLEGCAKAPAKKGDGANLTPGITTATAYTPTPTPKPPVITLQVVGCPASLTLNWDALVGTQANVNKVQKVICGSLKGAGSFEALVSVRYYTPDAKLDYYVYDNLLGTPSSSFNMHGLLAGDAQISPVGSLMTAEIGPEDTIKGKPDVFKEYRWNGATFAQVLFPGIYPDMTYYQAEQDQAQVNAELAAGNKQDAWKNGFFGPAENLARHIFHWTTIDVKTVRFRSSTATYIVAIYNLGPGGGGFIATMFHLDVSEANIFEIAQITSIDGTALIATPTTGLHLSHPVNVSGSSVANGNVLGKLVLYNDTFTEVGTSGDIRSTVTSGYTSFAKSFDYHLNSLGVQEAVLVFYMTNQNNTTLSNQVIMVKILLAA